MRFSPPCCSRRQPLHNFRSTPHSIRVVANRAFAPGTGPRVIIDEGHNNWHTGSGRYEPFADILRNDGYRVAAHGGPFTTESLSEADIVVVAGAIAEGATTDPATWLPAKSAFSQDEIAVLVEWVHGGGALLLIVDYMPFPAWAADLAAGFGIHLANGYAYAADGNNSVTFSREAGTLRAHPIVDGRGPAERVDSFRTFAGTALLAPYGAEPLLLFQHPAYVVIPEVALPNDTPPPADAPRRSIAGCSQGAVMSVSDGRLAAFGEAAAFSAQRYANGAAQGMNDPGAAQNKQFLINLTRWLAGML